MTHTHIINVAKDFSQYPGGRFLSDGEFSGQRFREEFLEPALRGNDCVIVQLDGTLGYGSSFLEEAFGGLVRTSGFRSDQLSETLKLDTSNETLRFTIEDYIRDAHSVKGG